MTMVSMPVDNSTLAITSIICAGLLFVFLSVAADDEFRKPPIAATIAIVAGGLLYWLGFIPIGIMITAVFALVVGIVRAINKNDKSSTQGKPYHQINTTNNDIKDYTHKPINSNNDAAQPHHVEDEEQFQKPALSTQYKDDKINHEFKIILICVIVGFACWGFFEYNKDNVEQSYSPTIVSSTSTPAASTPAITNQPLVTAPIEAPVNPVLMQQCDSYATANKRKEYTLTYQEQREDYNKLYEFCLDEAKKLAQTTSTNVANNSNVETVSNELLQAYQTAKIDNETSRQYINKTWDDLVQTLPDNQKSGVLKLQRAWIKSKQNLCGKVVKNKTIDNLTSNELAAEIKLLECDSQANSERAAVLSKTTQLQDEIAKIIKEGGK